MKKTIISAVIFICCINSLWAQIIKKAEMSIEPADTEQRIKRDNGNKRDENGNKINRTYYPAKDGGGVQTVTPMNQDKINGIHKMYYKSGVLMNEQPYINSVPTGVSKMYNEDGKLVSENQWVDGKISFQKAYYTNGNVASETPFVDMKINGIQKMYSENGQLISEIPYVDNKKSEVVKQYAENVNLKEETPTQHNTEQVAKTEEPVYRGTADPLKGLNVSKTKEIGTGKYYALIIGIDKYSGQWKPLNTAVHDAQAIQKVLSEKYKIDKFYTLYNAAATRSAIMNALDNLVNKMNEDDNVLIYFSGHGDFKKTRNLGYWIPVDATTDAVSNLVSNSDIQNSLASIISKHTLLISDACFSGDILRGNTLTVPFEESDKYYSKVYNLISRQALTSGGNEPVMDGGKDGHSVFAYYLLKNLQNNTNKYFDIGQLYNSLKVPVVNNSDQTPHLDPIPKTGDEGGQFIFIKK